MYVTTLKVLLFFFLYNRKTLLTNPVHRTSNKLSLERQFPPFIDKQTYINRYKNILLQWAMFLYLKSISNKL